MSETYAAKETDLEPGDKVLLYTDCLLDGIYTDFRDYTGAKALKDDLTLNGVELHERENLIRDKGYKVLATRKP